MKITLINAYAQKTILMTVIFAFTLLMSCSNQANKNMEIEKTPATVKKLEIEIPDDYFNPTVGEWLHLIIDNNDYLFTGGIQDEYLYIFPLNVTRQQYEKTIKIPREGPDGFNSSTPRFYVHNFDSIFVFPESRNHFLLYDSNLYLTKTFHIDSPKIFSITSYMDQQTVFITNGKIQLNVIPYARTDSKDFLNYSASAIIYDLHQHKIETMFGYPDDIKNTILPSNHIGNQHVLAFDSMVISNYYFDEALYGKFLSNNERFRITGGLSDFKHMKGLDRPIDNNSEEALYMQVSYPRYKNLFYDPYRKKIYRIAEHVRRKYKDLDGKTLFNKIFDNDSDAILTSTVIQLNEKLEVEKLFEVPGCSYYFPVKDGLFVCSYDEKETKNIFNILSLDQAY